MRALHLREPGVYPPDQDDGCPGDITIEATDLHEVMMAVRWHDEEGKEQTLSLYMDRDDATALEALACRARKTAARFKAEL